MIGLESQTHENRYIPPRSSHVTLLTFYPSTLINLVLISWSIIFAAITSGHGEKDDLALLSITGGLFARISLARSVDTGFSEISELGAIAHMMWANGPPPSLESDTEYFPSGFDETELLKGYDEQVIAGQPFDEDDNLVSIGDDWAALDDMLNVLDDSWGRDGMVHNFDVGQNSGRGVNADMSMIC
jgi:hypothetical protein